MDPYKSFEPLRVPHAQAAAPFSARPPSPPSIIVPTNGGSGKDGLTIVPSFKDIDSSDLTEEDLAIITRGQAQSALDTTMQWEYESRRQAQAVLDFLYLGPSSVARDREWLSRQGITMVLVARDTSFAQTRIMSVEKNCAALGIVAEYIDTPGRVGLVRAFPDAVKRINDHMLEIYRSQAVESKAVGPEGGDGSSMAIGNAEGFRRGKILVCCETGNDRSPAIVAAYIMSVFGTELVQTLQFIIMQRFCVVFDEDMKHLLQAYQDIVSAKRDVNRQKRAFQSHASQLPQLQLVQQHLQLSAQTKRNIEDIMMTHEGEGDMDATQTDINHDTDRYLDRAQFVPFIDGGVERYDSD